jgi:hypothetical protein
MQAWMLSAQARPIIAASPGHNTAVHHHLARPLQPRARVRGVPCLPSADGAVAESSTSSPEAQQCEEAKSRLFRLVDGTQRGVSASRSTRVAIQEAALALEAFGQPLDLNGACPLCGCALCVCCVCVCVCTRMGRVCRPPLLRQSFDHTTPVLSGRWRLTYTTASDVLVLLEAERASFGLLQVGEIYQSFDAYGSVENLIYASATPFLVPDAGVALRVRARYAVAGSRSIRLAFEDVSLGDVRISDTLETLLAPALLPRTPPQMWLLQALRELNITLPLPGSGRSIDASPEDAADGLLGTLANGGAYLLGYCDRDTLVGRALTGGGLFIFDRENDPTPP